VVAYNRRGFGASGRSSVGYDYDMLAADLGALLDQLDLREVVLAGFCSGTGEVTHLPGPVLLHRSARRWPGQRSGVAEQLPRRRRGIRGGRAAVWREDFRAVLARIRVPVLVVQGGLDRIMPQEATGKGCPACCGPSGTSCCRTARNAIFWTHADEVNRALLDFIRGLPGQVVERMAAKMTLVTSPGL
jgi:non-heme chloroperoxidase